MSYYVINQILIFSIQNYYKIKISLEFIPLGPHDWPDLNKNGQKVFTMLPLEQKSSRVHYIDQRLVFKTYKIDADIPECK